MDRQIEELAQANVIIIRLCGKVTESHAVRTFHYSKIFLNTGTD